MKTVRWALLGIVALGVLFALGSLSALAAPVNNGPATAYYIDNQAHTIDASAPQWYRFDYGGGNELVTVTMVQGANTGLSFNVYTPAQAADLATTNKPIGRGTVLTINCNSGIPAPGGGCQGDDLIWTGKFPASGAYFVEVINNNPTAAPFTLTVAGDNVGLCPDPSSSLCQTSSASMMMAATTTAAPAAVMAAPTPAAMTTTMSPTATMSSTMVMSNTGTTASPTAMASTTAACTSNCNAPNTFYTDPYHALSLTNTPQTIPGNSSIWYRFEYVGDNSNITLNMPDGALNGLSFHVYTPAQAPDWYSETAIGSGTATPCTSNDVDNNCGQNLNSLLWQGKFPTRGTYFVQVTNPNNGPVTFTLNVTGSGVGLCSAGSSSVTNSASFQEQFPGQNSLLLPCPASS